MGGAPVALFPRVIRAPVFGRAYSGAPTLLHADFYGNWRAKVQNIYRDENLRAIRGDPQKAAASNGGLGSVWACPDFSDSE